MNELWVTVPAPPIGVYVHDDSVGPQHPLTPDSIRTKRGKDIRLDGVVWRTEGLCGLIVGITERTWLISDVERFVLSFSRPAKGSGNVSISVVAKRITWPNYFITTSKRFSDEQVTWSQVVLRSLAQLGFTVEENDEGYAA